jgi:hypothetical protein
MINTDKKKWSTPRLRVFVRTEAGERILAGCKTASGSGFGTSKNVCQRKPFNGGCTLTECTNIASS